MSTRLTATSAIAAMAAAAALLGACGDAVGPGSGSTVSPTSTPSATTTASQPTNSPTTAGPTPTPPPASPTSPGKPNTTMTVPPPARDQSPPPKDATAYAQEFVLAWATGNAGRGELLATATAYKQAFASRPKATPKFDACEGAAGSSYCTFTGDEYTMVVRVRTQTASAGDAHAVTEVRFAH